VLAFAALASSADGQDPVDAAIRSFAHATVQPGSPLGSCASHRSIPPSKRADAIVTNQDGDEIRVVEGAPGAVAAIEQ
jgi:H+-transporting ATPase